MTSSVYSIRDDAADYFIPPFVAQNDAMAKRMFISSLGDSWPHRSDFHLFWIGEFDDDNGTIRPIDPPKNVLSGMSIDDKLDPRPKTGASQ